MAVFTEYGDPIAARNSPGPQCLRNARNFCGKLMGGNWNPCAFGSSQHATGLVTTGYREENIIESLNAHALKVELKAFIGAAQLSHGGHKDWEITSELEVTTLFHRLPVIASGTEQMSYD